MSKKHKKRLLIGIPLLAALVFIGVFYYLFYDTQRIKGQEEISQLSSPAGTYTATAYRNNGGATTSFSVLVTVTANETGRDKNIYWNYKCEEAQMYWEDEETLNVNGLSLDVTHDVYDFRKE